MKTQTISIRDFMSGEYKENKSKKDYGKIVRRVGTSIAIPLVMAKPAFAQSVEAVPVSATQVIGEKTLEVIAHALDPLIDLMVALSFPIASVVMLGACFFFMFGQSDRAWSGIMNAGLGYILINLMPLLLNILKEVGNAI